MGKDKGLMVGQMISSRDTEIIIRVLGAIREIWLENPDLRLMQLLLNACSRDTETEVFLAAKLATRSIYHPDPYYIEDNSLLEKLRFQYSSTQYEGKKRKRNE